MKFVVDECTGPQVADWLASQGFDVFSVARQARGIKDVEVLGIANKEQRILITNDRDFGELIFKNGLAHQGVIFMRLNDETARNKINVLQKFLEMKLEGLDNKHFIIVTEESIRIRKIG